MFAPAVVVHGLDHARLALASGRPVCLLSGPGAGRYAGVGWWRAMIEAALSGATPGAGTCDMLDCDDAPGAAMAALRDGQRLIVLDPRCPAFPAVQHAATSVGSLVLGERPAGLDLFLPDAAARLDAWLATGSAGDSARGLR